MRRANAEWREQIAQLRNQDLSTKEIAELVGCSAGTVSLIAREIGRPFTKAEARRNQSRAQKENPNCGGQKNTQEIVEKIIAERVPQFEYAGGYTGSDGNARIRCKKCGTETIRSWVAIRHSNVRCEVCSSADAKERRAERNAEAERQRKEAEAEKERAFWARPTKQEAFKVCKVCGGMFLSNRDKQYTCGGSCTKKLANRRDRRLRYKGRTVDRDITLEELFRRDKGICYLCGVECDWDSMTEREDGTKIAGDWYPSIDHVKPIAKGGLHSWNNVRLAHRICNYLKSDTVIAPEKILRGT